MTSVDVVIPNFNAGKYLRESVASALAQEGVDVRVFVVDNASTDDSMHSLSGVSDPRLNLVTFDEHVPMVESWSRALLQADRPFVKLLPADDRIHPSCLRIQSEVAVRTGAAVVSSRRRVVTASGRSIGMTRGLEGLSGEGPHDVTAVFNACVSSGTNVLGEPAACLLRTEDVHASLPWTTNHPYAVDVDQYFTILNSTGGSAYVTRDVLSDFRISGGSASSAMLNSQAEDFYGLLHDVAETIGVSQSIDWTRARKRAHNQARMRGMVIRAVNAVLN